MMLPTARAPRAHLAHLGVAGPLSAALSMTACWGVLGGDVVFGHGDAASKGGLDDASTDAGGERALDRGRLAAGDGWGCAIHDGGVYCWGDDGPQLGTPHEAGALIPSPTLRTNAAGVAFGAIRVTGNDGNICRLDGAGSVYCWGNGQGGMNGRNERDNASSMDIAVRGPLGDKLTGITQVATGGSFSCAVDEDASVFCWGADGPPQAYGQLTSKFDGGAGYTEWAVLVESLHGARTIALGLDHGCAIFAPDGQVRCWGRNDFLQTGGESQETCGGDDASVGHSCVTTPIRVGDLRGMRDLALTATHSCALSETGDVYCWGRIDENQLNGAASSPPVVACITADPNTAADGSGSPTPTRVPVDDGTAVDQLAASVGTTCALKAGEVWCWGRGAFGNSFGAIGHANEDTPAPVQLATPEGAALTGVTQIAMGSNQGCALLKDDALYCWGEVPGRGANAPTSTLATKLDWR